MYRKRIQLSVIVTLMIVIIFVVAWRLYNNSVISDVDLVIKAALLKKINSYPNNQDIDPEEYSKFLGTYKDTGLNLIEIYHCSDICPGYGGVYIVFEDIHSAEDCTKVNGRSIYDASSRGYIGCTPEMPSYLR